jgi:ATP-dependent Clp protease ATP-binding subunit ClpA
LLDKFTEKALKAVINSQEEARRLSHPKIGTEHLLLGLLVEGTGIPARVLRAVGLTVEELRSQVAKSVPGGAAILTKQGVSFSNQAIQSLKAATEKAKSLGYIYVGSEHIFMALLSHENYGAIKVLKELDIDIDRIVDTVTRITVKRSLNRAHPEIQLSKKLTEISKAIKSRTYDVPFNIEDKETLNLLNNAKEEMKAIQNDTIGTEHLLLALAKFNSSKIQEKLEAENLTYNNIIEYLSIFQDRSAEYTGVNYQLTPVAYYVLEKAHEISTTLGSGTVTPEHIILSLLKEDKGIASLITKHYSINTQDLYRNIIEPIEKQRPPTLSIMRLAQEEARSLDYSVVGTEHILLGLLSVGIGLASKVLHNLGVNLNDAREEVKKVVGYGTARDHAEITYTPRAKKLLELAWDEAKQLQDTRIESEHLLLAIIRLKDCMAMTVLTGLGVDAVEIRQGIMAIQEETRQAELSEQQDEDL